MRMLKGWKVGAAVTLVVGLGLVGSAEAEFSTERPGSILIFPKVVNAAGRDTQIQITNTSNMVRHALCFYVNGAPENPNLPPDPDTNPPLWQVTDFRITLTRQQPTTWAASLGRRVDPTDAAQGLDPGSVPPVVSGFTGELVCVEVDDSGSPISGNALVGDATVVAAAGGDAEKYAAIAVEGLPDNNADNELDLDNVEYSACPAGAVVNFASEGGTDATVEDLGTGTGSQVNTTLTLVPCSRDFANSLGSSVTVAFTIRDEFESPFSASTTVDCWRELSLSDSDLSSAFSLSTPFGTANLTAADGDVGFVGVASVRRVDTGTGASGTAATNLHFLGNEVGTNVPGATIVIRGF